jgi:hypothetical protein
MVILGYSCAAFLYLLIGSCLEGVIYNRSGGQLYTGDRRYQHTHNGIVPGVITILWPFVAMYLIVRIPFDSITKKGRA